jgi:hypothetical protein
MNGRFRLTPEAEAQLTEIIVYDPASSPLSVMPYCAAHVTWWRS